MQHPFVLHRGFVLLLVLGSGISALPSVTAGTTQAQAQPVRGGAPNIVLILADDLGWGDPGCYNPSSRIPTPHLDRLAKEGQRWTDAHSPSAVCTPTRYGLLTGRYAWRTKLKRGVLHGESPYLIERDRPTLPAVLRQRGYLTACIGKWHLGLGDQPVTDYSRVLRPGPLEAGFTSFFGIPASLDMPPYLFVRNDRATAQPTDTIAEGKHQRQGGAGYWRGGKIAPGFTHEACLDTLAAEANAFLKARVTTKPEAEQPPFFLYYALTAPHTPWLPTADYRGKTPVGAYGDFVVQVDRAVGDILRTLDETRLAANTLVIVTSDNGSHWYPKDIQDTGHRSNGPWKGQKADAWEGGHRVPLLARWPGHVPANATTAALFCHTDFFPTLAALANADLPAQAAEDGFNQAQVFLGQPTLKVPRDAIVNHSVNGVFAVRQGPWKLITALGSGGFSPPATIPPKPGQPKGQLYHLGDDPGETQNLWTTHPDQVERLTQLLQSYQDSGRSAPIR